MPETTTKTKEYKIHLNKTHLDQINKWRTTCRKAWNTALGLLDEHDRFTGRAYVTGTKVNKEGKEVDAWECAPCCPLPWRYRRIDKKKGWEEGNIAPFCPIETPKPRGKRRGRPVAPAGIRVDIKSAPGWFQIVEDFREPTLGMAPIGKYTLQYYLTQKNHPNWKELKEIPSWYIRGVAGNLYKAWSRYKSSGPSKQGKPRFKSRDDITDSLHYGDAGKIPDIEPVKRKDPKTREPPPTIDGIIHIPGLGKVRAHKLWEWGDRRINVLQLTLKVDGLYLQLTSTKFPVKPAKPSTVVTALSLPYKDGLLAVDDRGVEYRVPTPGKEEQFAKKQAKKANLKLKNEQRADRQQKAVRRIKQECRAKEPILASFLFRYHSICQWDIFLLALFLNRYRLLTVGKNLKKTRKKIARISAIDARIRKSAQQKIAHFATQRSGTVIVEDKKVGTLRKPKPRMRQRKADPTTVAEVVVEIRQLENLTAIVETPPHYDPNGASQIAEINKERSQLAIGQFVELIKTKSKEFDRTFEKHKPKLKKKEELNPQQIAHRLKQESQKEPSKV